MDRSVKTEKFRKSGLDVRSSIFAYQKHNIIFKCRLPYREQIQIKKNTGVLSDRKSSMLLKGCVTRDPVTFQEPSLFMLLLGREKKVRIA